MRKSQYLPHLRDSNPMPYIHHHIQPPLPTPRKLTCPRHPKEIRASINPIDLVVGEKPLRIGQLSESPLLPLNCVGKSLFMSNVRREAGIPRIVHYSQPSWSGHTQSHRLCISPYVTQTRRSEHRLLGVDGVGLRAEAAGSRARGVEVAAESRGEEGAEDELGTPEPPLVSVCRL